ncbi:hypothetical protein AQUCO_00600401v1 [Aquilegia coerulea]|uniref:Cytochrome P450 n=1 Tax=Aquilegia coerulea TaxID=218851 RepID=A0A2G5EPF9_AQUCA|nr:hypothetical protein AQUCO_00600401v1 [Aquilegia coerulea]
MKSPMPTLSNDVLPRVQPHIHLWTKLYGRNFLGWHGYRAELFVTKPDLIKEVLNNKNGLFIKAHPDKYTFKLLGNGLVIAEGKNWNRQRKLANHAFHIENLKNMVPTMAGSVENMLEKWGYHEGKEIEALEEFRVLTSDVITKTAFGSNYLEGEKIFDMLTKLTSILNANVFNIELPVIGKFLNYKSDNELEKVEKEIKESFMQIIRKRKEKKNTGELDDYGSDYLGLLINANQENDEEKRISIDDMIDECKTFYFAGQETTMGLLTWAMLLLATHTEWQEKARKEVFDIFGEKHPNTENSSMAKMKIMTMIMNETLRLYPPALNLRRTVSCEVRLGEILLPPNINIIIPPLVSHNDPQIWGEDVHLFRPDRFAEGVTKAAKNTNAYLPFGMGPRNCVGSNFATIEVKVALSMILQRYAFTLSPTYMHSPIQYITVRPQHGVQIILHPL